MKNLTPLPWELEYTNERRPSTIRSRDNTTDFVTDLPRHSGLDNARANGEFIIHAANNHAALVASLTAVSAALADHITREAKAKDVTPENLCPCATTDLKAALILLHTIRMAK